MSDKHGSAREIRDPDTPDTLAERLKLERDRRALARGSATSQATNTPASAEQVSMDQSATSVGASARSRLRFGDDRQSQDRQPAAPQQQEDQSTWEDLFDLKHEGLLEWMKAQGADDPLMAMLVELQIDGDSWRAAITDASSTQLRPDLEDMIRAWSGSSSSAASVMRITIRSKLALEAWIKTSKSVKLQEFSLKEISSIKLPDLPAGKGADGRINAEQLKAYCEALQSNLNIVDKEYSRRVSAIHISPTLDTLKICFEGMTARAWQLDELVGSSLMKKAQDKTISNIIAIKRNKYDGNYSGLCTIQYLGESTTQLTGARLCDLLLKLFQPLTEAPTELIKLEPAYKTHKDALNSLTSLDIDLHPVIQCFVLQQMASKLAMKAEHNLILGIPMAGIIKDGFEDLPGMISMVESAIMEASNDPKQNKPRIKSNFEKKLRQIAALTGVKSPERPENRICVTHREEPVLGYVCLRGDDCKFKHSRSGKVCTAPEYEEYGRCLEYFGKCQDNHPFTDKAKAKYGSPQVAWQALCSLHAKPKKGKGKGKAYPIWSMDVADAYLQAEDPVCPEVIDLVSPSTSPEQVTIISEILDAMSDSNSDSEASADSDSESSGTDSDSDSGSEQVSALAAGVQDLSSGITELKAATMSKADLEAVLGRTLDEEKVGVARLEASIKIIEARESRKDTQSKPRSDPVRLIEQERCRQYEQSLMQTLEENGGTKYINAVAVGVPMIMFDSGTYRHIWGTDLLKMGLVTDIQKLPKPEKVETAAGEVTLSKTGSVTLKGITFKGVINEHMRLSLISEGTLFVKDGWCITCEQGIKTIVPAPHLVVAPFNADMYGNLAFWPQQDIVKAIASVGAYALVTQDEIDSGGMCNLSDDDTDDDMPALAPVSTIAVADELWEAATADTRAAINSGGMCHLSEDDEQALAPNTVAATTRSEAGHHRFIFKEGDDGETQLIDTKDPEYSGETTITDSGADSESNDSIDPNDIAPHREHYQPAGKQPHFETPAKQGGSRSSKYDKYSTKPPNPITEKVAPEVDEEQCPPCGLEATDPPCGLEATTVDPPEPVSDGIQLDTGTVPMDTRTDEYKLHCNLGHPFNPRCPVCIQASMRAKKSTNTPTEGAKGIRKYHQHMETAVTDTLKYNATDVDNNKAASGLYLKKTSFGTVSQLKNFTSVAKEKAYRDMQRYIQSHTDPGGKLGYKMQRMKMDQGTENQGAALTALSDDNVLADEGHADRHKDQNDIENYFGRLQTTAAAMGIGAYESNTEYDEATMGTRISHAATVLQYRPCSANQKEMGTTPIEEQFHPICNFEAPKHSYGELVYAHIEKKDRPNKTGPRAYKAIYAGECRRVKGNIIVHPISPNSDRTGWIILPSTSVNQYKVISGYYVLTYTPDHKGQPVTVNEIEHMTYEQVQEWLDSVNVDSENESELQDGTEEVECILDHADHGGGELDFKVRWVGHNDSFDTWHNAEDLVDCEALIKDYCDQLSTPVSEPDQIIAFISQIDDNVYEHATHSDQHCMMVAAMHHQGNTDIVAVCDWQIETLMGSDMTFDNAIQDGTDQCEKGKGVYPVVEIPVPKFMQMEGGPEAVSKEIKAMEERRFNKDKPIPQHIKHTALECRIICTQKRDGRMKARLVAKDLKSRRKLPETSTYAAVPAMYGFRLIIAAADARVNIISTTDFDVAYLQTENRSDHTTWVLIKYRDPHTNEWVYVWIMGVIYGEQPAGKSWKDSLTHKMVVLGGFQEVLNMENMYWHPIWKVAVGVHVDDPLVVSQDEDGYNAVHDFLDKHFDTKGRHRLTTDSGIDYLSMELTLTLGYDVLITNLAKCEKLLADADRTDCIPTKQPPMTKQSLKTALQQNEPLTEAENKVRMGDNGRFGWLAQTTHLGLAVATSIAQGLAPTQGTKQVSDQIYQWIQAHKGDGLISKCDDYSGLQISSDSDWAGMHSVTGEVRSRTGTMICYNGMPIWWYTGLQKTTSSQWYDGLTLSEIATSSANGETLAASDTLVRGLHVTYVSEELNVSVPRPIVIDIDANAALGFLNNTGGGGRMKHIDIREAWIQQLRDRNVVTFNKVDGKLIKANFMTKLLDKLDFNREYAQLAYQPETSDELEDSKGEHPEGQEQH